MQIFDKENLEVLVRSLNSRISEINLSLAGVTISQYCSDIESLSEEAERAKKIRTEIQKQLDVINSLPC